MIYLVRHAQAYINVSVGKIEEGEDFNYELTKLGEWQARRLADYFSNINFSKIFASPYVRTQQTAKYIADTKNIEIVTSDLIKEIDCGDLAQFANPMSALSKEVSKIWKENPSQVKFPNGESFEDIKIRSMKFLNQISNFDNNTVVVTHRDVIRTIISSFKNDNYNTYWQPDIENASITVLDNIRGNLKIAEIDYIKHLQ